MSIRSGKDLTAKVFKRHANRHIGGFPEAMSRPPRRKNRRYIMRNRIMVGALCATALAAAHVPARAETIYLECTETSHPDWKPVVVTLDTTNNTANDGHVTAQANIGATSVDWQAKGPANPQGVFIINSYHIDRGNGQMTNTGAFYFPDGRVMQAVNTFIYSCIKTEKPNGIF